MSAAVSTKPRIEGVQRLAPTSRLHRLKEQHRAPVRFVLNGQPAQALAGDTLMTAILTQARQLRTHEFSQQPRAGFCMMGACQDCWVRLESGATLRACQCMVQEGMRICTQPAGDADAEEGVA